MNPSRTHLVLIPAYNPGQILEATVRQALSMWGDVWLVVDGSTDRSHEALAASGAAGLRVIVMPTNGGKGSAVLAGATEAIASGFTHALVMDADGQHPADRIPAFMKASLEAPESVVCGKPEFGPEAPRTRLYGRKISVVLVHAESSGLAAADPLFGFRVYPLAPLVGVLRETSGARRYDFDPEVAVRLAWAGTPAINLAARCTYLARGDGGVSHFHYVRDNLRMITMHARLLSSLVFSRRRAPSS